jgi:hypothetical protein
MKDLTPFWIKMKALMFFIIGVASVILILISVPDWKIGLLLALAIWSFCRLYYFAFYVIEKYVDPSYKFSGLFSFVKYLLQRRR